MTTQEKTKMNKTEARLKAAKLGFPDEYLDRDDIAKLVSEAEKMLADEEWCFCEDYEPTDEDCKKCSWAAICEGVHREITQMGVPLDIDDEDDEEDDEDEPDDDAEETDSDPTHFAGKSAIAAAVKQRAENESSNFVKRKSWYTPKHKLDQFGFRENSKLSFVANLMFYGKHTREQILTMAEKKFDTVPENRKVLLNNAQNHLKARGYTVRTDIATGLVRIIGGPGIS